MNKYSNLKEVAEIIIKANEDFDKFKKENAMATAFDCLNGFIETAIYSFALSYTRNLKEKLKEENFELSAALAVYAKELDEAMELLKLTTCSIVSFLSILTGNDKYDVFDGDEDIDNTMSDLRDRCSDIQSLLTKIEGE